MEMKMELCRPHFRCRIVMVQSTSNRGVAAVIQVIYLIGWVPHESQPKVGMCPNSLTHFISARTPWFGPSFLENAGRYRGLIIFDDTC